MISTGDQYRDSIRDGRQVYINGERVKDVTTHPMFKPLVDIRARIYDMQHEAGDARPILTYADERRDPRHRQQAAATSQQDWWDKRRATDTVLEEIGGVVTRVGDETVGEMWSLFDGQDVLNEVDPHFSENIRKHVAHVLYADPFHVSANTDPKGDRSKPPQEQDPDMLLHVVKETDAGIVVRGAKYETAAAYANQAFTKPTIANWGNERAIRLRRRLHLRPRLAEPEIHLPHRLRRPRAGRRLSAVEPLRRGRHAGRLRRRADPLGERPLLPPHQGGDLHPLDAAPLLGLRLRAAQPEARRHDDRRRALQRAPDRPRQAAGGAGEARRSSPSTAKGSTRI